MSDIPRAREILKEALVDWNNRNDDSIGGLLEEALLLLDRKKPKFIAKRTRRKLSIFNADYARHLRSTGMSLNEIAVKLKSDIGRISEACA